jgi:hypothetical protein
MKMREQIFSEFERLNRLRRHNDLYETLSLMRELKNFSEEFSNGHSQESSLLRDIAQLASVFLLQSGRGFPEPIPAFRQQPVAPVSGVPRAQPNPTTTTTPSQRPSSTTSSPEPSAVQPLSEEQAVVVGLQILIADALASDEDLDPYVDLILQKADARPNVKPYVAALANLPPETIVEEFRKLRPTLDPTLAIPRVAQLQLSLRDALQSPHEEEGL